MMQLIVGIVGFLAVGAVLSAFREVVGTILGIAAIGITFYFLLREPSKEEAPATEKEALPTETRSSAGSNEVANIVWIAVIGFSIGGLLLWNALNKREPLRMVPPSEVMKYISPDLRARHEVCQLERVPPPHLQCELVEVQWQRAYSVALDAAMRSRR